MLESRPTGIATKPIHSKEHTDVEHAGLSIEQELYRNLCSEWPEAS
jgi:hypothetical protein